MVWTGTDDKNATTGIEPLSVYFFKGEFCYLFTSVSRLRFVMANGYPKKITLEFPGLPSSIDAAFVWSGNGRPYFVKGGDYYRFTRGSMVDAGYPRKLKAWKGLPEKIDAAFNSIRSGRTYFFSGQGFYRFNDNRFETDPGYPKNTASYWLGCKSAALDGGENMMMKEMNEGGKQFMKAASIRHLASLKTFSLISALSMFSILYVI